jgi:hypothetical protein
MDWMVSGMEYMIGKMVEIAKLGLESDIGFEYDFAMALEEVLDTVRAIGQISSTKNLQIVVLFEGKSQVSSYIWVFYNSLPPLISISEILSYPLLEE